MKEMRLSGKDAPSRVSGPVLPPVFSSGGGDIFKRLSVAAGGGRERPGVARRVSKKHDEQELSMARYAVTLFIVWFLAVISFPAPGAAIDAPHNPSNDISCPSCHGVSLANSPFWGGSLNEGDFDNYCLLNCHDQGGGPYSAVDAPYVKTHSSANTSNKYGTWYYPCVACHDPHNNEQNNREWRLEHSPQLYLAGGDIESYSYDGGKDESTILFSGLSKKAGWECGEFVAKSGEYRSVTLLPSYRSPSYSYPVSQCTDNGDGTGSFTVKGDIRGVRGLGRYPFRITYGQFIRRSIDIDGQGSLRDVKFFDRSGSGSFAHNDQLGGDIDTDGNLDDSTPDGICQVCHQNTDHWRNDGTLSAVGVHDGYNGANCTDCHWHSLGFKHGGDGTGAECSVCHNGNKHGLHLSDGAYCSDCHDLNNMRDGDGVVIDPTASGSCAGCHQDGTGGPPNDTAYDAGWTDPAYDLSCDGCHNGRPFLDTQVMASGGHNRLVGEAWIRQYPCYYCHDDTVDSGWNLKVSHANGTVDVAIADQWAIVGQPAPSYNAATQVCSNTYCHSDGTAVNPEMRDYPWSGGHEDCNACHGHDPAQAECSNCHSDGRSWSPEEKWLSAMPMYANTGEGTDRANTHFRHLFTGFSCDDCHADTVVGPCLDCHDSGVPGGNMTEAQHVNGAYHVNKDKTVAFKDGGTYNPVTKTCSNTACHTGSDPVWGGSVSESITCLECHGTTEPDVDDFGEFNDLRARINLSQWASTGHGRATASGDYDSGNPPANLPGNGCWYCHDNQVLHQAEDNPFRLRKHQHFVNRFEKECVYCHMTGSDAECLSCHDAAESLAPQLSAIPADPAVNPPYTISRPDHAGYTGGCSAATCHENDATRHKTGDNTAWTVDQKADVQNSYVLMGVCLKCHDDDSGGQCNSCHTAPPDDPETPDVDESLMYSTGFDPGLPGTSFIKPQQAKASSFHFGYKHYQGYEDSLTVALDSGTVSVDAGSTVELTDGAKAWTADEWAGYSVKMSGGVSGGEVRKIASNTASVLSLENGFSSPVQAGEGYTIVDPVWKGGKFCWDCHDPHGDDNIYMIQDEVATETDGVYGRPVSRAEVVFTRKQSGMDYARNSAPYNGICNVCHTTGSQHYAADRGDGHNAGRVCTNCHEHRFTDSHSSGQACNTCHMNKPVPRHAAFGLPRDCTKCHQGVIGKRMDIMGQLQANSHHIQRADGAVTNLDCYQCHWESTAEGLIDLDYHEGYNYKTHESVKNAAVDLVIWNGEESPGVDDDPTVGGRPEVYDPDGTDPEGPGEATVTTFLASRIAIGQGDPANTLADQRAEVSKVTDHCLGCHSDQNNDATPFGDCKTPRQYAWDRSSIASRYEDTGTATWGKYTGTANAAGKNITKAFSAHGNAVNNGGGWDAATGVDGTIPNTRDGSYAVQCFDCHSSHGSKVTGVTSSYKTFNGTKNGANLKETQAGKGGYLMTYKASANPDPNSVNPYNAGAGQCFDCHETADAGSTPWGYNSTFGAVEPVMGYADTPHFGQGARGVSSRYAYKSSTVAGGHLKRSSDLASTPDGTIDGLCSPCHDPHGVSQSLGADKEYAVPLLKGTWLTSPYKEDAANNDGVTGRRGVNQSSDPTPIPYIYTDQKTFGAGTINEEDSRFAGLCLRCHPKDGLTDGVNNNGAWKSVDRIHESVKGWGDNQMHNYSCSKCHLPHNSTLPRLMQTNCLNTDHRGRVASGGAPGSHVNKVRCGNLKSFAASFPYGKSPAKGNWGNYQVNCHPTGSWPDNTWNVKTPWTN